MAEKTLQFISTKMKNLDICMLTTTSPKGILSARPMSNNGDGKYEGDSYFFSYGGSQKIKDIEKDASVNLSFIASSDLYICRRRQSQTDSLTKCYGAALGAFA
ncbi:hypothetical protein BH20BAC1_BH20BAC1_27180 [soil metagenome]